MVQDGHVAGLELDGGLDTVDGEPGAATDHRGELERGGHLEACRPASAGSEPAGQHAPGLDEVENLGKVIARHIRTIARKCGLTTIHSTDWRGHSGWHDTPPTPTRVRI